MLFSEQTFQVPTTNPISVRIPDSEAKLDGTVAFSLKDHVPGSTDKDVNLEWKLSVPWHDAILKMSDNRNLFPELCVISSLQSPANILLIDHN